MTNAHVALGLAQLRVAQASERYQIWARIEDRLTPKQRQAKSRALANYNHATLKLDALRRVVEQAK